MLGVTGCGTTRMTDTNRAASEMLLISQAVDQAVAKIDFSPLKGESVFLDASAVDKDVIDRGYLVSLVRQQLLAHGALLQEDRPKAAYVVEVRSGGIGTDRHSLLVGTPSVTLPAIVPGVPGASITEIALVKRNDQRGVAKVGVFAYHRATGRALWQSGTVEAVSRSQDTWLLGGRAVLPGVDPQAAGVGRRAAADVPADAVQAAREGRRVADRDDQRAVLPGQRDAARTAAGAVRAARRRRGGGRRGQAGRAVTTGCDAPGRHRPPVSAGRS